MKRNIKRMMSIIFVVIMCLSSFASALEPTKGDFAKKDSPVAFGEPISERQYYDEELEATVTERIYFVPDVSGATTFSNKSGRGWYRNENTYHWKASDKTTTTFAEGYFIWGNGNVSVSNARGGYDYFPGGSTITEAKVTYGTGQYAGIFNKYAYVTYTFNFVTQFNGYHDCSVTMRVSENGNTI